jgi:hypothetical protein
MSIFSEDELQEYFPNLTLNQRDAIFVSSLQLVESYLGCNRSLEIVQLKDLKPLPANELILSHYPLVISEGHPFTVEIKYPHNYQWLSIDTDNFTTDIDDGIIYFKNTVFDGYNRWLTYSSNRVRNNQGRNNRVMCRIGYYSGFEFGDTLGDNEKRIKSNLLSLMQLKASSQYQENIKRFKLDEHYEVEYHSDNINNSANIKGKQNSKVTEILSWFKKFSPRIQSF